jgi:hypothetical protein
MTIQTPDDGRPRIEPALAGRPVPGVPKPVGLGK